MTFALPILTTTSLTQRVYESRRRVGIPLLGDFAGNMYTLAEILYCQLKNDLPRLIMYATDLLACHGSSLNIYLKDEPFLYAPYLAGNTYNLRDALADLYDELTPAIRDIECEERLLVLRLSMVVACAVAEMQRQGQDVSEQLNKMLERLE